VVGELMLRSTEIVVMHCKSSLSKIDISEVLVPFVP